MKFNIEDYLQSIDNSFKDKSQKDIHLIYFMIFASLFAISYFLFWDTSVEHFKATNAKIKVVEQNIKDDNLYLKNNPEAKIAQLEREIKKAEEELIATKETNAYIKTKIEAISFLIYDERAWGEYLHSISKNAKKYGVKILDFTNKYALHNTSFGHVLDITLETTGKYKNTLRLVNSLEQSDLVVDMHDINITASVAANRKKLLTSEFKISVWGIAY